MSYATSFFYGEIGAFAVIKYPMGEEFSFSPSFLGKQTSMLGFLDSLRYLGFLLGTVYSLFFPFRKPKSLRHTNIGQVHHADNVGVPEMGRRVQ